MSILLSPPDLLIFVSCYWDRLLIRHFSELKSFIAQNGLVDPMFKSDKRLCNFVRKQKSLYQKRRKGEKTSLTDERVQELEQVKTSCI